MKKFYYILKDNPNYPEVMMAESKQEVKNLLLENIGQTNEDQILMILSEEEMVRKNNPNIGAIYKDSTEYSNGNDFLNDVIKSANNQLSSEKLIQNENSFQPNPINETTIINPAEFMQTEKSKITYFEDNGTKFKIDSGKVYKKAWVQIEDPENYRIISTSTGKCPADGKYIVEKFDWIEIN